MNLQESNEYAFIGSLFAFDGSEDGGEVMVQIARALGVGAEADWFTVPKCRLMWTAVMETWTTGKAGEATVLDLVSTAKRISRKPKSEFADVKIEAGFIDEALRYVKADTDFAGYARFLRKSLIERSLRKLITDVGDELKSEDVMTVGNTLSQKVMSIMMKGSGAKEIDLDAAIDEVTAGYERAYEEITVKGNLDYTPGLPLPWKKLARLYNGYNAGYHILAGRPSVGKTSFALQLIRYWCEHGVKVLFNCLDMSVYEFLKRPISDISKVTTRKAMFGHADKSHDFPAIYEAAKRIKQWYHDGTFALMEPEYDVNAFKAHCVLKKKLGLLDVVVVDFIQLMRYAGCERVPETQKVTYVSGILKSISNELKIPVVALSQLKRADKQKGDTASEKGREPELDDLRSSGAIEQDAFTVTFLYQDDGTARAWINSPFKPKQAFGDYLGEVAQPVWVHVKKNQNGDLGRAPFVVFKDTFSWYLGDYQAELGDGKLVSRYEPRFSKVHDDWRHAECEKTFASNGSLISTMEEEQTREDLRKKREELAAANAKFSGKEGAGYAP